VQPEVIIADEPLSALDLVDPGPGAQPDDPAAGRRGLTYLFVTMTSTWPAHQPAHRGAVPGRVVEEAPTADIFAEPLHPYTQALVRAAPRLTTKRKRPSRL